MLWFEAMDRIEPMVEMKFGGLKATKPSYFEQDGFVFS